MTLYNVSSQLISALGHKSDIELRFENGTSIPAHSLKLSLASTVFRDLLDDVMDDQIESAKIAKRRRADDGSSDVKNFPHIQVHTLICMSVIYFLKIRPMRPCNHVCTLYACLVLPSQPQKTVG